MTDDTDLEPAVYEYAGDVREALGLVVGPPRLLDFEDAESMLQALYVVAGELHLAILGLPPDEASIMRLLAATYGRSSELALSLLEERTHRRVMAGRGIDDPDPDDDEEDDE